MTLVRELYNKSPVEGEVGVELEFEGSNLPNEGFTKYWSRVADGSLRGESGEFVLKKPLSRKEVLTSLSLLEQCFAKNNTVINDTFRAGTHIHVNVQDLTMVEVVNFLTLYYMFESTILGLCREDRVGNHFCLSGKDASAVFNLLEQVISSGETHELSNDQYRYGAVNLTSLPKFGSLEFRSLESSTDWKKLQLWIELHLSLKDAAKTFKTPTEILGSASFKGIEDFAKEVFKESWKSLKPTFNEQDVREGIWRVQSAVYSRDWGVVNRNIFAKSNIFDQ